MTLKETLMTLGLRVPENFTADLEKWVAQFNDSPCKNTAAVVGLSAVLFYALEKGRNPKVNDVWDAMVYCSTCLSVGYGDIFARTPLGKILGSTLMTMGPAMASKTLDAEADRRRDDVQEQTLDTLRKILAKLEAPAAVR